MNEMMRPDRKLFIANKTLPASSLLGNRCHWIQFPWIQPELRLKT